MSRSKSDWFLDSKNIKGILLDITGVLYDSGGSGGSPIPGSIAAIERLKAANIPVRFCTNETQCTKAEIAEKLNRIGFSMQPDEIFPPAPVTMSILTERRLRPHLLVHPRVLPEFAGVDQTSPNCVVIGDAGDAFSYENVNRAFRVLVEMENPILISMGIGKFYKEAGGLVLDVGAYTKALEYACGVEAEIVGKPSKAFFTIALNDMGIEAEDAMMIGDDIVHDVGGAQRCGIRGIQVRTGKFRPQDENHPVVTPDGYVDNLAEAIDLYLKNR